MASDPANSLTSATATSPTISTSAVGPPVPPSSPPASAGPAATLPVAPSAPNAEAGPAAVATLPIQVKSEFKVVFPPDVIKRSHELWEEARAIPTLRPDPQLCAKYVELLEDIIRANRAVGRRHEGRSQVYATIQNHKNKFRLSSMMFLPYEQWCCRCKLTVKDPCKIIWPCAVLEAPRRCSACGMEGLVEGRQWQGDACSFVSSPVWNAKAYGTWCVQPPATPSGPPATPPRLPATAPHPIGTPPHPIATAPRPPATPPRPLATPPRPPASPPRPNWSPDQPGGSVDTAIKIEDDDEEHISLSVKQDEVQSQGLDRSSGPLRASQLAHRYEPYERPNAVNTTARGSGSKMQSFADKLSTAADVIDNQLLNISLGKIAENLKHIVAGSEADKLPGEIDALKAILSLNAGLRCILHDTLDEMILYAQSLSSTSMKDEPR